MKLEHMTDNQLIMYFIWAFFSDTGGISNELLDELHKRSQELRVNLPKDEHIKYYGKESWNTTP